MNTGTLKKKVSVNEPKIFFVVVDEDGNTNRFRTKEEALGHIRENCDGNECCVFEAISEYNCSEEVNISKMKYNEVDFAE